MGIFKILMDILTKIQMQGEWFKSGPHRPHIFPLYNQPLPVFPCNIALPLLFRSTNIPYSWFDLWGFKNSVFSGKWREIWEILCILLHWITSRLCANQFPSPLISIRILSDSCQSGGLDRSILMEPGNFRETYLEYFLSRKKDRDFLFPL